ncbi:MAG TPA: hypothetical protein VJ577_01340 [Burkholderiaceae bacterium]|nr:hypothetical protein [Burkholderiaceae bacterium]
MMPTDRLTIRSTIFASRPKENTAAAEMLKTPAKVVASRMESSVELILDPRGNMTTPQIKTHASLFGKRHKKTRACVPRLSGPSVF